MSHRVAHPWTILIANIFIVSGSQHCGLAVATTRDQPWKNTRSALLALLAGSALATSASAYNGDPAYLVYDGGAALVGPNDEPFAPGGSIGSGSGAPVVGPIGAPFVHNAGSSVLLSFQGLTQYDTRALAGGYSYIPPDTMGAVGASQFLQTANGGFAVYSKTGVLQLAETDGQFWQSAGIPQNIDGAGIPLGNGDSRVLFDKTAQKWLIESFAPDVGSIQVAVSNDSNALDGFKATQFVGYSSAAGGAIADYPTLAIDSKAIYIGTNDFDNNGFEGTTLNVISRSDIFGAGGPVVTSLKQFVHDLPSYATADKGYAIQGVNQVNGTDTGKIAAIGAENYGTVRYDISNPGTAGATEGPVTLLDTSPYAANTQPASRVFSTPGWWIRWTIAFPARSTNTMA